MTCGHPQITKQTYYDLTAVVCLTCHHTWKEAPIAMDHEEYDSCLLILAAYDLARDWSEVTADI